MATTPMMDPEIKDERKRVGLSERALNPKIAFCFEHAITGRRNGASQPFVTLSE